jgi:hypothetical protein
VTLAIDNICYLPLDIPVPELDVTSLISWHNEDKTQYSNYLSSMKFNNRTFTFDEYKQLKNLFWIHGFCVNEHSYGEWKAGRQTTYWVNDFDTRFPDLANLFSLLPNTPLRKIGFLFENSKYTTENMNIDSNTHIDEYDIGFRVSFNCNTSSNTLFVREYNSDYVHCKEKPISLFYDKDIPVDLTHYLKSPVSVTYPLKNTAFMLNGFNSAHGVSAVNPLPGNEKVTFIAMNYQQWSRNSRIKHTTELYDLILRSYTKFKDYAILIEGKNDIFN